MQYTTLGRTGVQVSTLCFGTMSFGREADEATSARLFNRCREEGINFFDCANVYAGGDSEKILGKLLADCRDQIVLTSKVCMPTGKDVNDRGMSRRHIMLSIEASLTRLDTDRLDVYFIHHFDTRTPIEETLLALDDLVRQGKILYPGVSNWAAWQIAKALGMAHCLRITPFYVLQPMYNLAKRQAEVEILPMAESENLGVISYSPLGGGLLTGKYAPHTRPDSGRLVTNSNYIKRYEDPQNYQVAQRFTEFANSHGYHPVSLAVAWVQAHPAITAPILGARNLDQLNPALDSVNIPMTPQLREEISAISATPPLATDRAEEQSR